MPSDILPDRHIAYVRFKVGHDIAPDSEQAVLEAYRSTCEVLS